MLLVSFALVTLAGNDAVGQAFTIWAYRHSVMVLGTLVLLIYFAALMIDELRQEQEFAAHRFSRTRCSALAVHRRPGIVSNSASVKVPDQERTIS